MSTLSLSARIDEVNIVGALASGFAGFLRSGEFTYDARELSNRRVFESTSLLRSNVTFSDNFDHAILTLKRSKTDIEHKGVQIVLAASSNSICPVRALKRLFDIDVQPPSAPLFRFSSKAFLYNNFVSALRRRLDDHSIINSTSYSGHSLRRGAATQAKINGMLDSDIQQLRRWSSEAFQRYIETDINYRFRLSRHFLTGLLPPLSPVR